VSWTILAVHAHPDDESITMGGTLARAVAAGHRVVLLTCTLGEEGEVIGDELAGLAADQADQLGGYRLTELRTACEALGVTERRQLGGVGRYRDSGMAGTASTAHPRAFVRARVGGPDHEQAVDDLLAVLADLAPDIVLTYAADGGYGHPDHLAAHEVAVAAAARAGVPRVLAVVKPRAVYAEATAALQVPDGYLPPVDGDLGCFADRYDIAVDVGDLDELRRRALAAHATQVEVLADGFALSNRIAQPLPPREYFTLIHGAAVPAGATDIGAGL